MDYMRCNQHFNMVCETVDILNQLTCRFCFGALYKLRLKYFFQSRHEVDHEDFYGPELNKIKVFLMSSPSSRIGECTCAIRRASDPSDDCILCIWRVCSVSFREFFDYFLVFHFYYRCGSLSTWRVLITRILTRTYRQ